MSVIAGNSASRYSRSATYALFLSAFATALGCSKGSEAVEMPSPLVSAAIELEQSLIAKQDELDVATDMVQSGRADMIARVLPGSMDDLVPLARKLADAAENTDFQAEAVAIAEEVEKLPPLARKQRVPDSLKGPVTQLGERVSALVAKVRES